MLSIEGGAPDALDVAIAARIQGGKLAAWSPKSPRSQPGGGVGSVRPKDGTDSSGVDTGGPPGPVPLVAIGDCVKRTQGGGGTAISPGRSDAKLDGDGGNPQPGGIAPAGGDGSWSFIAASLKRFATTGNLAENAF
ncbi:MAG: hypothetical protein RBS80_04285 [Thermoguttaceae bacterium]|nr:hypothetical protein [Thermoguttaceae bacterium]